MVELPELQEDDIVLRPHGTLRPAPSTDEEQEGSQEGLIVRLVHVRDPKTLHQHSQAQNRKGQKCELWARMWSSSTILAEMLCTPRLAALLPGVRTLEIGAGTAVCGLTAALQGAQVLVTDCSNEAMELARRSAERNGVTQLLRAQRLDWHSAASIHAAGSQGSQGGGSFGSFDLILGSDVLFVSMNVGPVVHLLDRLLSPQGVAIIIDPGRLSAEEFEGKAQDQGFLLDLKEAHHVSVGPDGQLLKRLVLYILRRGPCGASAGAASVDGGVPPPPPQDQPQSNVTMTEPTRAPLDPPGPAASSDLPHTPDVHGLDGPMSPPPEPPRDAPTVQWALDFRDQILGSWQWLEAHRSTEAAALDGTSMSGPTVAYTRDFS